MKLKTDIQTTQEASPLLALAVFGLFGLIVGVWYLFKHRRKVRRWIRRTTRKKHFWGYVLAGFLFVGFGAFFLFLDFRY